MRRIACDHLVFKFDGRMTSEFRAPLPTAPLELAAGTYTFKYDYPLSNVATFTHKLKKKTTVANLLSIGRKDYERIYREEDKYGIWGHDIEDLVFEEVEIDEKKKTIYFEIGS